MPCPLSETFGPAPSLGPFHYTHVFGFLFKKEIKTHAMCVCLREREVGDATGYDGERSMLFVCPNSVTYL